MLFYLAEFNFRYNHRVALGCSDIDRTKAAIKGIEGKRLTYHQLTEPDHRRFIARIIRRWLRDPYQPAETIQLELPLEGALNAQTTRSTIN